jgi:hypothetical protein
VPDETYLTKIAEFCKMIAAPGQVECGSVVGFVNQFTTPIQMEAMIPPKQKANEMKSQMRARDCTSSPPPKPKPSRSVHETELTLERDVK